MMQKRTKAILSAAVTIIGFAISITVIVLVVISRNSYNTCQLFKAPYSLIISKGVDDILVTWYVPWPNEECGVTYTIEYAIDDGQINTVNTAEASVSLPRPNLCSSLSLEVWGVNEAGERSHTSATGTYNEIPSESAVTNIQILPTKGGLEVTWERPADLERCNFEYRVVYYADLGIEEIRTASEYIVIPDNGYCFQVTTYIYTYVFGEFASLTSETYENHDKVSNIVVTQSLDNINEMIVTWAKHSRHDACLLTYDVEFTLDGTIIERKLQTQDLTATVPAIFCSIFVVIITAYSTIASTSSRRATEATKIDPKSLGPIQDLQVSITEENEATISWTPPKLASKCTYLEYKVSATNEDIPEEVSCTGTDTCSLILDSFCPETTFTVREITGITEEVSITRDCD